MGEALYGCCCKAEVEDLKEAAEEEEEEEAEAEAEKELYPPRTATFAFAASSASMTGPREGGMGLGCAGGKREADTWC